FPFSIINNSKKRKRGWIIVAQAIFITVLSFICFLFVIFLIRTPGKVMKLIGNGDIHMTIALLLLFFFNVFSVHLGCHISLCLFCFDFLITHCGCRFPFTLFTVIVTIVLGVFVMGTILAIHLFIL